MFISPFYKFIRPADTTAYTATDLIANSTTAGSVVPMSFNVDPLDGRGRIIGGRLFKTNATVTAAKFNVHLYHRSPTVTNGDNSALAVATSEWWIGTLAFDLTSGAEIVSGVDSSGLLLTSNLGIAFDCIAHGAAVSGGGGMQPLNAIYGLIEANGAYTPLSAENFKVTLLIEA